jgi:outer membrane receptor protein involved in Fe transport
VQPDSIKNYELGAKTTWLNKRLTVNAAIYRIDWTAIQQDVFLPCGFDYVTNLGEARIKGAELELNAAVTDRLSIGISGSYTRARLEQDFQTIGALAGDQIEYVPNWQGALHAETTFPILDAADGFARVDYQYTGSSFGNYNRLSDGIRDPLSELDVTRLLNLKTGMRHHVWEFSISVNNLLNHISTQSIDPNAGETVTIPGRPRYVVTRPRTFFVTAIYRK